jgi:hypothetical protein
LKYGGGRKMCEIIGMTINERNLRKMVTDLKANICSEQSMVEYFEKEIKRMHQERCPHTTPQAGDDGCKYCHDCGKAL